MENQEFRFHFFRFSWFFLDGFFFLLLGLVFLRFLFVFSLSFRLGLVVVELGYSLV